MSFEDQTLTCVQCQSEFTFSGGEQEFYAERNLNSPPKRCKDCRKALKKSRGKRQQNNQGVYSSPAFNDSAPAHQKVRGRGRGGRFGGKSDYRSPMDMGKNAPKTEEYRSPAFRDQDRVQPDEEYRSPAFQEYAEIDPKEEYRAPGFQEYAEIDPKEEYRSPGFQDKKAESKDERPLFEIQCTACGETAMVPFLPDERENPMCQDCFKAHREEERAKAAAEEEAAKAAEVVEAPEAEVTAETGETAEAPEPTDTTDTEQ